jgi:hypothetical protein
MELKKYTAKEAELILEKVSIILGLNEDNIPGNKKLFIELFISEVLDIYGDQEIFSRITKVCNNDIEYDIRFYNKPISIAWFIGLCKVRLGFNPSYYVAEG